MIIKNIINFSFSILLVVIVAGCAKEEKKELKIAISPWPGYEPIVLALHKGFFGDMKVRIVRYPTPKESFRAFRDGEVDIAAFTTNEMIHYAKVKDTPKIFLIMDISNGGDALFSQADIKSIDDLKGKKIGLAPSELGEYLINRALDFSDNISREDVTLVAVEFEKQIELFTNKEIDAIATYNPNKALLLTQNANNLFDSSKIPYEIVDVLVTSDEILKQRKEDLIVLKNAWFKAVDYISKNEEETMQIMAEYEGISVSEFESGFKELLIPSSQENRKMFNDTNSSLYIGVKKMYKQMSSKEQITKNIDINKLFISSIVNAE